MSAAEQQLFENEQSGRLHRTRSSGALIAAMARSLLPSLMEAGG
jgi:hypothetical protein